MTERQNNRQVSEYGRLMGIKELMAYTSLGRNSALELGKNACAIVRIGKRVLYDRKKIDIVCDCQESPVISVFERPPPGHLVQNWYGIGKILANLQTLSTQFHSILPHRKTRKE